MKLGSNSKPNEELPIEHHGAKVTITLDLINIIVAEKLNVPVGRFEIVDVRDADLFASKSVDVIILERAPGENGEYLFPKLEEGTRVPRAGLYTKRVVSEDGKIVAEIDRVVKFSE